MRIDRKELIRKLSSVKDGADGKATIEQSDCFVFHQGKITTFNDIVAISTTFDMGGESFAVPHKKFLTLLNKIKDPEIEILIKDSELRIKGKRYKSGLPIQREIKYPIDEAIIIPETGWIDIPMNFMRALQFCLFSASKEDNRQVLQNVNITTSFAESSDQYRMTRFMFDSELGLSDHHVLIPRDSIPHLIKQSLFSFAVGEGWIHFKDETDTLFYSCRTAMGDFPTAVLDDLLEIPENSPEFPIPEKLKAIIDRAETFSEDGDSVIIDIRNMWLTVRSEGKSGWSEERVRCRYKGDPLKFMINPSYFKEILGKSSKMMVNDDMLFFNTAEFQHAIGQMKSENPDAVNPDSERPF